MHEYTSLPLIFKTCLDDGTSKYKLFLCFHLKMFLKKLGIKVRSIIPHQIKMSLKTKRGNEDQR